MPDGQLRITASFEGAADLASDEGGSDLDQYLRVKHSATACGPCLANHNVRDIPFSGCLGNLTRIAPRSGKGNLCHCSVELVIGDDDGHHDF